MLGGKPIVRADSTKQCSGYKLSPSSITYH